MKARIIIEQPGISNVFDLAYDICDSSMLDAKITQLLNSGTEDEDSDWFVNQEEERE